MENLTTSTSESLEATDCTPTECDQNVVADIRPTDNDRQQSTGITLNEAIVDVEPNDDVRQQTTGTNRNNATADIDKGQQQLMDITPSGTDDADAIVGTTLNNIDQDQQQPMDITPSDTADEVDAAVFTLPTATPNSKKSKQPMTNMMLDGGTNAKNGSSNMNGAKRKTNFYVNMLDFVKLVLRIAVDVTIRKCTVDDAIINMYIRELTTCGTRVGTKTDTRKLVTGLTPAKRMRMDAPDDDTASSTGAPDHLAPGSFTPGKTVSNAEAKTNEAFQNLSTKPKEVLCISVVNNLFIALERANASLHFSREYLKYFLATYQRSVTVSNFVDTNRLKNGPNGGGAAKKQKSTSRLQNGAILLEYAKSPYMFASNLSRCDPTDVEALRFIVETGISVSPKIYRNIVWRLDDVQYNVDKIDTQRPDHVRVPIMNFKRAALLIGESVILLYDGTQFVLPTSNIERDITATMIASARLKRNEHIVLDVLLSNKLRVIDIIKTNKYNFAIPEDYEGRLKLIADTFQGIKTVTLDETFDGSYLQKSKFSHDAPVYIYYKPNHTLAAVGMRNNTVWLAYQDDNGNLVYRLNTVNSGPASLVLGVAALQTAQSCESGSCTEVEPQSPTPTISLADDESNSRNVRILGLENESDVHLFSRAIRVELKDGNTLGSLSANPVTNLREYKPPTASKDANGATVASIDNLTAIFNDPNNFGNILKALTKSTQFDAFIKGMHSDVVSLGTADLGY